VSRRRIGGIFRKELRDYRRNGPIIAGMVILPLIFLLQPLIVIFTVSVSTATEISQAPVLIYMLAIPAIVPATLAASAVVSERQQATLEPVLTTPIRADEFLLGKALAVLVPSLVVSYLVFGFFAAWVELFAPHAISAALLKGPELLAQLLFTPLIASWSIWPGMAISTRVSDTRTAQQFGLLSGLPSAAVSTLVAFKVIPATLGAAIVLAVLLLLLNGLGWRIISATFNTERLISGAR
jgi:ABC-type Na+ efflux pump permease subunit